ncbi:MAG: cold-shock protein, partial [Pseudomonadales bacterium]
HDHDDDDGGERRYDSSDRETGTVKWFNVRKGYGFITRDAGDDVFVHFRNIEGSGRRAIEEGQRVSFVVTDGDKGLQADEVSPA